MGRESLFEGFMKLGMTPREINEATTPLGGRVDEVDRGNAFDSDDAYLFGENAGDSVDEGFAKLAPLAVRIKNRKAARIRRRSGAGRAAYQHQLLKAKTSTAKRKRRKHEKLVQKRGGAKKGYRLMTAWVDNPGKGLKIMTEKLLESVLELAEAIDRDPESRFDEYVEAFNHIADIGELAAIQLMDEDEDAAKDVLELSMAAESILNHMESLDGALTEEEDELLNETLEDAMESVGVYMSEYGLLSEDDDDDSDDDDDLEEDDDSDDDDDLEEDIFSAFRSLSEAAAKKAKGKMGLGGKKANRMAPRKTRAIMTPKGIRRKKGVSAWSKAKGNDSRRQISNRKDVRNKEKLLGYLRQVKMGRVAPGQSLGK